MNAQHTKEPWRIGRNGGVVADEPVPEIGGSEDVEYYGGHLIAESVAPRNARRIVACINACAGLHTDWLETVVGEGSSLNAEVMQRVVGKNAAEAARRKAERQRDELLNALQQIAQWRELIESLPSFPAKGAVLEDFDDAGAALAKATGGAS